MFLRFFLLCSRPRKSVSRLAIELSEEAEKDKFVIEKVIISKVKSLIFRETGVL